MIALERRWERLVDLRAHLMTHPHSGTPDRRYNAMVERDEVHVFRRLPRTAWVAIALRLQEFAGRLHRGRKAARGQILFLIDRALDAYHRAGILSLGVGRGPVPQAIRDAYLEACDLQRSVL